MNKSFSLQFIVYSNCSCQVSFGPSSDLLLLLGPLARAYLKSLVKRHKLTSKRCKMILNKWKKLKDKKLIIIHLFIEHFS